MATEKTDVVIVGVGAAGGIMAAELGKAGMKVIALERGPRLRTADFAPQDELRFFQRQDLRPNVKRQPVTWRPNANTRATHAAEARYGNKAGGGTVHYGAVSWRFHEDDFRARSHTIERYGIGAIPEGSSLADWPMNYAELEPYYDQAEYDLGVSGQAGNVKGKKIDGGNPLRGAAPARLSAAAAADGSVRRAVRGRRQEARLSPVLDPARDHLAGLQGPAGLHLLRLLPGFRLPHRREVEHPRHQAAGGRRDRQLHAITGAMCHRVNSDNSGKVTGVSYYGPDGSDNTIEAEIVVLGTFIYDNTRLLLLSKTEKFPNGLANSRGQVGKHFMTHIGGRVFAAFDDRYVNNFMGPSAQKHTLDDFNGDNFDHGGLGFIRGAQISVATADIEGGPIGDRDEPAAAARASRAGARAIATSSRNISRAMSASPRRPRICPIPTRRSTSIRTCATPCGLPAPRLTYDWRSRTRRRGRVHQQEARRDRPRDGREPAVAHRRSAPGTPGPPP